MTAESNRTKKLLEVKRKIASHRLTRIAQCNPRTSDWAEATENVNFQRSLAKDPSSRSELDIENILIGLKTCRALQVNLALHPPNISTNLLNLSFR